MKEGIMSKLVEAALNAVWPCSIPSSEYARAVKLVMSIVNASTAPQTRPPKPHRARQPSPYVSEAALNQIRGVLSTGPATASEIQDAIKMNPTSIHFGLKRIAMVSGHRKTPNGNTARLWVLKTPT